MSQYRIKDWSKYQHYKTRTAPPWIKLHKSLIDDPDFHVLSGDASKTLALCWLIASESDGYLPAIDKLAFRLRIASTTLAQHLIELKHWIVEDASTTLADRLQDACLEEEGEEEKKESSTAREEVKTEKLAAPPSETFFQKCREYILEKFPLPGLGSSDGSPIHLWQAHGYDFERHIKPVVDSKAARGAKPGSFSYFTPAIENAAQQKISSAPAKERPVELSPEERSRLRNWKEQMGLHA